MLKRGHAATYPYLSTPWSASIFPFSRKLLRNKLGKAILYVASAFGPVRDIKSSHNYAWQHILAGFVAQKSADNSIGINVDYPYCGQDGSTSSIPNVVRAHLYMRRLKFESRVQQNE